jgi:hypothetical protein
MSELKIIHSLERHSHLFSVFATNMTKRSFGIISEPVRGTVRDIEETGLPGKRLSAMVAVLVRALGCLAAALACMHENHDYILALTPSKLRFHPCNHVYRDTPY